MCTDKSQNFRKEKVYLNKYLIDFPAPLGILVLVEQATECDLFPFEEGAIQILSIMDTGQNSFEDMKLLLGNCQKREF